MPRGKPFTSIGPLAEIIEDLDRRADLDGRNLRVGDRKRAQPVELKDQSLATQPPSRSHLLQHRRRWPSTSISIAEEHEALVRDPQILVILHAAYDFRAGVSLIQSALPRATHKVHCEL